MYQRKSLPLCMTDYLGDRKDPKTLSLRFFNYKSNTRLYFGFNLFEIKRTKTLQPRDNCCEGNLFFFPKYAYIFQLIRLLPFCLLHE